jgi:hypothetical protein
LLIRGKERYQSYHYINARTKRLKTRIDRQHRGAGGATRVLPRPGGFHPIRKSDWPSSRNGAGAKRVQWQVRGDNRENKTRYDAPAESSHHVTG